MLPNKSKSLPFRETSFYICWLWSLFMSQLHELPYKFSEQSSGCTEWFNILVAKLIPENSMTALNLHTYTKTRQKKVINTVEKTKDLAPGSLNWILFSVRTTASTLVEWLPFEKSKNSISKVGY